MAETWFAETWFVADKLLGFVGNSLNFGNYHNSGFDVEGYNNLKLDGTIIPVRRWNRISVPG